MKTECLYCEFFYARLKRRIRVRFLKKKKVPLFMYATRRRLSDLYTNLHLRFDDTNTKHSEFVLLKKGLSCQITSTTLQTCAPAWQMSVPIYIFLPKTTWYQLVRGLWLRKLLK